MEVSRNYKPNPGFLEEIRKLTSEKGIVLIFDECTSGFRQTQAGLHELYGVNPDVAMFGKALGNGYAITSIVGKEEVMDCAQETFISSTFWTERIGPTAALATLKRMDELRSWDFITSQGLKIKEHWNNLAEKNGFTLSQWGIPALSGFTVDDGRSQEIKTFISQEMLKRGVLAANSIYVSIAHTDEVLNRYFHELDDIFYQVGKFVSGEKSIDESLEYEVAHSTFSRLN